MSIFWYAHLALAEKASTLAHDGLIRLLCLTGQMRISEPVRIGQGPRVAQEYVGFAEKSAVRHFLCDSTHVCPRLSDTSAPRTVIQQAEEEGLIHANTESCIFEGTSGSTGISIAGIARARGYKARKPCSELAGCAPCLSAQVQRERLLTSSLARRYCLA